MSPASASDGTGSRPAVERLTPGSGGSLNVDPDGIAVGGAIRSMMPRPARTTIDHVRGSIAPIPGTSEDFDAEIEQAWMDEVERRHHRSASRSRPALS